MRPTSVGHLYCSSVWLSAALRVNEAHGVEPQGWLASKAATRFRVDDNLAPVALIREAWELAETLTGSPTIGVRTGFQSFNPASWQSLGLGIICSHTVKDGLIRLAQYYSLLTNIGKADVETTGSKTSLIIETVCPPSTLGNSAIEFGAAALVHALKQISPSTRPIRIALPRQRDANAAALEEAFGCAIDFNSGRRMVVDFERTDADLQINDVDPQLAKVQDGISELKCSLSQDSSISGLVENAIMALLPDEAPTLERVAQKLCISSRTLQRRLTDEDTSFSQVTQETLKRLSYLLVCDSSLMMKEISFAVGFSDPACFARAFRQWHGESPAEIRRSMRRQ